MEEDVNRQPLFVSNNSTLNSQHFLKAAYGVDCGFARVDERSEQGIGNSGKRQAKVEPGIWHPRSTIGNMDEPIADVQCPVAC
jgi:hypothetical protein